MVRAQGADAGAAIRLIVPAPRGSAEDLLARTLQPGLSRVLGEPVAIGNYPGRGGMAGVDIVARSGADGRSLLLTDGGHPARTADSSRALTRVSALVRYPLVILGHPESALRSVRDIVREAKRGPGRLSLISPGAGSAQHVAGKLLEAAAGIELQQRFFEGSPPGLSRLFAGQVPLAISGLPAALAHVRAGRVHALAVTTASRARVIAQVPAVAETLPGYEVVAWQIVSVPAAVPRPVVAQLQRDLVGVLQLGETRRRLEAAGYESLLGAARPLPAVAGLRGPR